MASCRSHNGADCQKYRWSEDAGRMWGCCNDLLRIWLKLMKAAHWGLPLTLVECLSPISVPFYSLSHSGCLSVCWLFFPVIVFRGSGESYRDVCAFVCESWKYSTFSLAPALWKLCLFLFCSCLTAFNERHKQLGYYSKSTECWIADSLMLCVIILWLTEF